MTDDRKAEELKEAVERFVGLAFSDGHGNARYWRGGGKEATENEAKCIATRTAQILALLQSPQPPEVLGGTTIANPTNDPAWPLSSFDARDWAEAFCERFMVVMTRAEHGAEPVVDDEGLMTAWFSNALMRGFEESDRLHAQPPAVPVEEVVKALAVLQANIAGLDPTDTSPNDVAHTLYDLEDDVSDLLSRLRGGEG